MLRRFAEKARALGFEVEWGEAQHLVVAPRTVFSLHLDAESDQSALGYVYVRTWSSHFDGERTDLHHILSLLVAVALRGQVPVSGLLIDQPHEITMIEGELYGRYVTFDQPSRSTLRPADERLWDQILGTLAFVHMTTRNVLFAELETSRSGLTHSDERLAEWQALVLSVLGTAGGNTTAVVSRQVPDWDHFYDHEQGISVTRSAALASVMRMFLGKPSPAVEGPNAWLVPASGVSNSVARSTAEWANRSIHMFEPASGNDMHEEPVRLVPLENWLVAVGRETVIAKRGDFGREAFLREREALRERQQHENRLIFPTTSFQWNAKIEGGRFEALVGELLRRKAGVTRVRQVGLATEPDGGRDFICDWAIPFEGAAHAGEGTGSNPPMRRLKVIVQCKAVKGSVGISDVTGMRDTIQHYEAEGYLLVVSNRVSVPLIDRIEGLKRSAAFSEWWDRTELERQLRSNRDLLDRFSDVVVPAETESA